MLAKSTNPEACGVRLLHCCPGLNALPKRNVAENATSESHERILFWTTPNDA